MGNLLQFPPALDVRYIIMNTQEFCYWLQGYQEISKKPGLNKENIILIGSRLADCINTYGVPPYSDSFVSFLAEALLKINKSNFSTNVIKTNEKQIFERLNAVFLHVIDDSYDTDLSREALQRIHDGQTE